MIPILTPDEMAAVDRRALAKGVSEAELVLRAGAAVAAQAIRMMGGAYGRRVTVVAGKGNNGADGRAAAELLSRRGARAVVIEAGADVVRLPPSDLVIDAAYGNRGRTGYQAPRSAARVLAVDIPSGVNPVTGEAGSGAVRADSTVCLAALKPGLILDPGFALAGRVTVADIGLDVGPPAQDPSPHTWVVEPGDVGACMGQRSRTDNKWTAAVVVVAGSAAMAGAGWLAAMGAIRAGAGLVRMGSPGSAHPARLPTEALALDLGSSQWPDDVLAQQDRCAALVVGPGVGSDPEVAQSVRTLIRRWRRALVVDADALGALGDLAGASELLSGRDAPTVLTPHDGEFTRLGAGDSSVAGPDRLATTRAMAARLGSVVLRKGPTTVIADPRGEVAVTVSDADARLATAGTGDVLAGMVGAFLARPPRMAAPIVGSALGGRDALMAAAAAAQVHLMAAEGGWVRGLIAGDLPDLVPAVLSRLAIPGGLAVLSGLAVPSLLAVPGGLAATGRRRTAL
ncbi:MAG: NAD(P)H-hydrate dehydratase [Acidimicrobiales bacterium]